MSGRWKQWRERRRQRRDVEILAPTMHRCGLPEETTLAYFLGHITIEQWRDEANKHSRQMQEALDGAIRIGANPDILNGYIDGTHTHAELMAEWNRPAEARRGPPFRVSRRRLMVGGGAACE
jgi:hypothetical protein